MAVYVDDMYKYKIGEFRGMRMSHMISDSPDGLFYMADQLDLRREWFQPKSYPHFDIAMRTRTRALEYGAIAVTMRELIIIKRRLQSDPVTVQAWINFFNNEK